MKTDHILKSLILLLFVCLFITSSFSSISSSAQAIKPKKSPLSSLTTIGTPETNNSTVEGKAKITKTKKKLIYPAPPHGTRFQFLSDGRIKIYIAPGIGDPPSNVLPTGAEYNAKDKTIIMPLGYMPPVGTITEDMVIPTITPTKKTTTATKEIRTSTKEAEPKSVISSPEAKSAKPRPLLKGQGKPAPSTPTLTPPTILKPLSGPLSPPSVTPPTLKTTP